MSIENILSVEDSEEDQFLHEMVISEYDQNLKLSQAYNGHEALNLIQDGYSPDLILLDINMPRMDGFGFLDALKKEFPNHCGKQVVVMLSSSAQTGDIRKASSYPCVRQYIEKPLTIEKLDNLLSTL